MSNHASSTSRPDISQVRRLAGLGAVLLLLLMAPCDGLAQGALNAGFAGGNGQFGCMFDLEGRQALTVCGFDLNLQSGTWTIEVYSKPGSHVGAVNDSTAWGSPVATRVQVVSSGLNTPTPLALSLGIPLGSGETRGFYITAVEGTAVNYTNGAPGSRGAVQVEDANLRVLVGTGVEYPFLGGYSDRMWNGVVHYAVGEPCEPPRFQTNSSSVSLTIGGAVTDGNEAAIAELCLGETAEIVVASPLVGQVFEIGAALAPLLPRGTPGTDSSDLQTINVDGFHPTLGFFNGGAVPLLLPFIGSATLRVPITAPLTLSAQMAISDPSFPEGFRFSQGATARVAALRSVAGPNGDDDATVIDLTAPPLCLGGGVTFLGTTYTSVSLGSNGRLTFGLDDLDFSPSVVDALADDPFIGAWCDLDPSTAGEIRVASGPVGTIAFIWDAVAPFAAPSGTVTSFQVVHDVGSGAWSIDGLGGLASVAGETFLGLSPGTLGATDPGQALFLLGSGTPSAGSEMIYEIGPGSGLSPVTGGLARLAFLPTVVGGEATYDWVALP